MKQFDPTKPVQTRDGRKARILCTDYIHPDGLSIVALITQPNGEESLLTYTADGRYWTPIEDHITDLVNVPVKKWRWAWKYYHSGMTYSAITDSHYTEEQIVVEMKKNSATILGRILETEIEE